MFRIRNEMQRRALQRAIRRYRKFA